jgi:hypothetical protein
MPLEGHYARQTTPLRALGSRERRLVAFVGGAIALACVIAVAAVVIAGGASHAAKGCIEQTVASTTGGARYRACGDAATATCRAAVGRTDSASVDLLAACRRAGIPQ